MRQVDLYTDGSCAPTNPGPGGWAYLRIEDGDVQPIVSGNEAHSTNNRMELTAAIEALRSCETSDSIRVHTDSQYVRQGILFWIKNWKKRNWKRKGGPVKNQDLWQLLDVESSKRNVEWFWTKAHSGIEYNELVDQAARSAASGGDSSVTVRPLVKKSTPTNDEVSIYFSVVESSKDDADLLCAVASSKYDQLGKATSVAVTKRQSMRACTLQGAGNCLGEVPTRQKVVFHTNSHFLYRCLAEQAIAKEWFERHEGGKALRDLWLALAKEIERLQIDWILLDTENAINQEIIETERLAENELNKAIGREAQ